MTIFSAKRIVKMLDILGLPINMVNKFYSSFCVVIKFYAKISVELSNQIDGYFCS